MNLVILIIMLFSFIIHHRSFQIKKLPRRIVLELKRYASEFANDSPIVDTSNSIKLPPKRSREGLGFAKGYTGSSQKYILEYHQLSGLPLKKQFVVLGIETSCDDTGVGIVTSDGKILSNIVYSQYDIHQKFGGIVPGLAMAAHKDNIEKAIDKCLEVAGFQSMNDIDAIAVTKGPGLEICLRVGLRKAQNLAKEFAKPLVTVHHHEAHCLISRIAGKFMSADNSTVSTPIYDTSGFKPAVEFPFLAILASGGHTSIMLCKALGEYEVLGATLDDALGEAVDKASRLLGLQSNTSGGAAVEIAAKNGNPLAFPMSIPMKSKINCDFSYAGLKNSFRKLVEDQRKLHGIDDSSATSTNAPLNSMEETKNIIGLPEKITSDLCASFQNVVFSHIEDRLVKALDYVTNCNISINALTVVGGVAANQELRRCTDNGVMVAWAGIEKLNSKISDSIDDQEVIPRWPIGTFIGNTIDKNSLKNNVKKM